MILPLVTACGNGGGAHDGPPPPLLSATSWSASWSGGTQPLFPVAFESVGQSATVALAYEGPTFGPPYAVTSASCATATASQTTVTIVAVSAGSCNIVVMGTPPAEATIPVTVP